MMPLFQVAIPANAGMFFAQMMQIAAFEVIDTKPYLDKYLNLQPTDPLNANFEAIGLESVYFLHNLGTLSLAFVFFVATVLFSVLLVHCNVWGGWLFNALEEDSSGQGHLTVANISYYGERLQKKLFWGSLIHLMTESYSMLTISCMINMRYLKFNAVNTGFMSLLTIVVTLVLLAIPIYMANKLTKNFSVLQLRPFKTKYAAFYEELQLQNGEMVLL